MYPEVRNAVTDMRVQCLCSNSASKAAVTRRLAEAGIEASDYDDAHVLVRQLPLETPEVQLVEELRDLVHALLPIIRL